MILDKGLNNVIKKTQALYLQNWKSLRLPKMLLF